MRAHNQSANPNYKVENDEASCQFRIAEDYPYFEGHFPGNPIVPGVVQIGWAMQAIKKLEGREIAQYSISRYKFLIPIAPNSDILVSVKRSANTYSVTIESNGSVASKGRIAED